MHAHSAANSMSVAMVLSAALVSSVGWANSTAGVHTFLTFTSPNIARDLRANPADPRAKALDFVWGADESVLAPLRAANPATRTSKYIPCCRDTSLLEYGEAAREKTFLVKHFIVFCSFPLEFCSGTSARLRHRPL